MTSYILSDRIPPAILAWADELTAIRRDLHQHPELGFDTPRTCGVICEKLNAWGIPFDNAFAEGAVVCWVEGLQPGPTVALRADMDALAMPDLSENSWCSEIPQRCHACGHDGHTAWLLGAMRALKESPNFAGRVVGVFQPAEEIGSGAKRLVEAGLLETFGIQEIYGAHGTLAYPAGETGVHAGPSQASCDFFYITLKGRGTHAARPHMSLDPVPTAALLSQALQLIVSRKTDPLEPCVLSICAVQAGDLHAPNVIPEELRLSGTIRTFSPETRALVEREMKTMALNIAESQGLTCEVRIDHLTPHLINAEDPAAAARAEIERIYGEAACHDTPMSMAGEDFAEYTLRIPGTMIQIGMADSDHQAALHNPKMDFNDRVLPAASWFLSSLARSRLKALAVNR